MASDKISDFGFLHDVESLLNKTMGFPAGTKALRKICHRHAGAVITIPHQTAVYKNYRDKQIRLRYNGSNAGELAVLWSITVRTIKRIVNT